uniref:TNFR-Cys domain-containing protein n=1 Tax=Amphilophus citrinellus TaxID=61819 RepID=A0A3Q0QXB4_AMPCI
GSYELEGRTCCLCSAGQRVKEHCTPDSQNDGQCEHCENGTYNSVANFQETCQPCTSCSHPNAHLEEEEPCTIVRNTKCRCKKHHFCSSKECTICHPCKICGFGGIKADCTATSDTVCNDAGGAIAGIVVLVFILVIGAIVAAGYVVIRRKTRDSEYFYNVNLEPLLPDTAKELGWKDMRSVAGHTGVTVTVTESCKMEHPNDPKEQTLQLLRRWLVLEWIKQASIQLLDWPSQSFDLNDTENL